MGKVINYITDSKGNLSSRRKLSSVEIHDTLTRNSVFRDFQVRKKKTRFGREYITSHLGNCMVIIL